MDKRQLKKFLQMASDNRRQRMDKLKEYIDEINAHYPDDIVNYYSPNYADKLLKRLDEYGAQ